MDLAEEVRELRSTVGKLADHIQRLQHTPKFLKSAEVEKLLGVSKEFLYEHRRARTGPPFLQDGDKMIRYPLDGVMAWANERMIETE